MSPNYYQSFAEFEREYIRPGRKVGLSVEDILHDNTFEREFRFDRDPFAEDEEEDEDDF